MRQILYILVLAVAAFFAWRWKEQHGIQFGAQPVQDSQSIRKLDLPPVGTAIDVNAIQHQIIKDGAIDEHALEQIGGEGDSSHAAVANYLAARFEYEHQRPTSSLQYVQRAELFAPAQSGIRTLHAALMLDSARYTDAITEGEVAVRLDSKSAEALRILGLAYYQDQQLSRAIEAWQRSLELHPDANLQQQLEKAQREYKIESNYVESRNGRFVLRYESGSLSDSLREELFRTLGWQYDDIARDLGVQDREPITISIYTRQQFLEVTRAPEWVGALNDGQLRIPLGGVNTVSPQVKAVLKHELTHWFVHQMARQCPVWLHEGVAQMEEPRSTSAFSPQLREQIKTAAIPSLVELEKPFTDMPADQAQIAYAKSLAAVEYLRSNYGVESIRNILVALGRGSSIDESLRSTTDLGYDELQRRVDVSLGR